MRKITFLIALILVVGLVQAQAYKPEQGKYYHIMQTSSQLYIGATAETQPAVQTLVNHRSQSFQFVPVAGKDDTYHLLNRMGMYLNKFAAEEWNYWTSIFESTVNGLYSEWVIVGATAAEVRLQLVENGLYLASDGIEENAYLYVDKSAEHANGLFSIVEAAADPDPEFSISETNVVIELEPEAVFPLNFRAADFMDNINVTVSAGFDVFTSVYTPQDMIDNNGNLLLEIYAYGAEVGDTGVVEFSYTKLDEKVVLDTVYVTPVPMYTRHNIVHNNSGLVIGTQSTSAYPALTQNEGAVSQRFLLRPVNPGVDDSLFYLVQDGYYRMFRRVPGHGWNTDLGTSGDFAKWKIVDRGNGIVSLMNFEQIEANKVLGADGLTADSRLYHDKTWSAGNNTEWRITEAFIPDETTSNLRAINISTGILDKDFDPAVTEYTIHLAMDVDTVLVSGLKAWSQMSLEGDSTVLTRDAKSMVLAGIGSDGVTRTEYSFTIGQDINFSQWDADGATGALTNPTRYGWKCDSTANWTVANATTAGTNRYIDNPANFKHNGVEGWTGRILYLRWDGAVTANGVYSVPVYLEGAKLYQFKGKLAWNSVVPAEATSAVFSLAVNSARDNSGTSYGSEIFVIDATDLLNLHDASFNITAPADGVYYLTIANSVPLLAAFADMSIEQPTSVDNPNARPEVYASVSGRLVNVYGVQAGDQVKVFNMSGQMIGESVANSSVASFNLNAGAYLIKVNNTVLKVVK